MKPAPRADPRPTHRALLASVAGCVLLVITYSILRIVQGLAFPEPNPAIVIWSDRAGIFWRLWTAAYAAGMGAILIYAAAGTTGRAEWIARALPGVIAAGAALVAAQGLLLP